MILMSFVDNEKLKFKKIKLHHKYIKVKWIYEYWTILYNAILNVVGFNTLKIFS